MKKRLLQTAAALLAAVVLCPCNAEAISAQKAILVDAQTGRVLYEKNADSRSLIASTTKIMTALVVCERCNVLDRVKIPKQAVGIEGSSMYLVEEEVLTVQELLYGLMLHSGNDAAVALAIYCGGTVEGFVELMNDKARELGLHGTHFENPNGLDGSAHYSTARDLAVLSAHAMQNPIFAKTVGTRTVTVGRRSLRNHNKLLWQVEGADGIKTGYTRAAGRILVSSATRQNRRLIAVTIQDGNDWADHAALLNEGFCGYTVATVAKAGQSLGTVYVLGGTEESVQVLAAEDFQYSLGASEQVEFVMRAPGFVYAPVVQGADAGFVYVCVDGKPVGKIPVRYEKTVEQAAQQRRRVWDIRFGGE